MAAARGRKERLGLGFAAPWGFCSGLGGRWGEDVAAPEPRELTCSLVALTVRGRSTGRGLAGPCSPLGVVGGPKGLPPPSSFPFFLKPFLFFFSVFSRSRKRKVLG